MAESSGEASQIVSYADLLAALRVELEEHRTALRELHERLDGIEERHHAEDHPAAALLHALVAAIGDREFSAREVIDHAQLVDVALRQRLALVGATTAKRLGRWFARIEDQDHDGLVVFRLDEDDSGLIWRIRATGGCSLTTV